MKRKQKKKIIVALCGVLILIWGLHGIISSANPALQDKTKSLYRENPSLLVTKQDGHGSKANNVVTESVTKQKAKVEIVNWRKPSEKKSYPNLKDYPQVWFDVNISKQRVYIRDGANNDHILYTMYCSTGKDDKTPHGTFNIQAERGLHFYNASEQEGANYYVSWLNHGEYLFHSVPVDAQGNYVTSVANNIGKTASSHGCVQLTIADAQWVYNNVPYGMKVVIH